MSIINNKLFEEFSSDSLTGNWGIISRTGHEPLRYSLYEEIEMAVYKEGIAIIETEYPKHYGVQWLAVEEKSRNVVKLPYDDVGSFENGLAMVEKDGKTGYINQELIVVVPLIYDYCESFSNDIIVVAIAGYWGLIDTLGNEITSLQYEEIDCDFFAELIRVREYGSYGVINTAGVEIVAPQYEAIEKHNEDFMYVQQNDKWGILDREGQEVVPCVLDEIILQQEPHTWLVIKHDCWGLLTIRKSIEGNLWKWKYVRETNEFKY